MVELTIILFLSIVAPVWIIAHYSANWRKHRGLTMQDEAMLKDLHEAAEKINDRLGTIERILDDEIPDWRKNEDEKL
jgi:phage shock protein B